MEQYLPKSALIAEIDRELESISNASTNFALGRKMELANILSFLDTLEVKEVHDIWHDVSEKPELEQPLLIIMKGTHKDFRRHYRIGCYGKRANDIPTWVIAGCYSDSFISKWCYISDILQYTSEAKEVDLEKELIEWHKEHFKKDGTFIGMSGFYLTNNSQMDIAKHFFELGLKAQSKDMIETLRTEYEKGRHDVIEKTLKWLWGLNQEHEIMSYTDSHILDSEELQQYYKNIIE